MEWPDICSLSEADPAGATLCSQSIKIPRRTGLGRVQTQPGHVPKRRDPGGPGVVLVALHQGSPNPGLGGPQASDVHPAGRPSRTGYPLRQGWMELQAAPRTAAGLRAL